MPPATTVLHKSHITELGPLIRIMENSRAIESIGRQINIDDGQVKRYYFGISFESYG